MIIKNMDFKEYRSHLDSCSVSELKSFIDSPFSYHKRYILGIREDTKLAAFTFGSLAHCLILEPQEFERQYYVTDVRKDARTKAYQEELERAAGRECISAADLERARECAASASEHLRPLGAFDAELSYFYEGPKGFLGQKVKARFDGWLRDSEMILDVKTTNKLPTYDEVVRAVMNYKYAMQVAWYMDIHKCVTGKLPRGFVFLFTQSEFPYASAVYTVGRDVLDYGREQYRKNLRELIEAKISGNFPRMRPQHKTVLHLPDWAAGTKVKLRRLK